MISASRPASPASSPNAERESVTMSDVSASSAPDASARDITPSMPLSMSSAFQPAIAMNPNASAASVAVNFVVAPSCSAFALMMFIAVDVASAPSSKDKPISLALSIIAGISSSATRPEIALTLLIAVSKALPVSITDLTRLPSPLIALEIA